MCRGYTDVVDADLSYQPPRRRFNRIRTSGHAPLLPGISSAPIVGLDPVVRSSWTGLPQIPAATFGKMAWSQRHAKEAHLAAFRQTPMHFRKRFYMTESNGLATPP